MSSHAALADWATNDEYTQKPLLQLEAGGALPPAHREAAIGGGRPAVDGRPRGFRGPRDRSWHVDFAEGGAGAAGCGGSPRPWRRVRADCDLHRQGFPERARVGGGCERARGGAQPSERGVGGNAECRRLLAGRGAGGAPVRRHLLESAGPGGQARIAGDAGPVAAAARAGRPGAPSDSAEPGLGLAREVAAGGRLDRRAHQSEEGLPGDHGGRAQAAERLVQGTAKPNLYSRPAWPLRSWRSTTSAPRSEEHTSELQS